MKSFRVGIDSYSLSPLGLDPFAVLAWAERNGADGVQFSEVKPKEGQTVDNPFLRDLAGLAREKNLYLEWAGGQHIPYDQWNGWKPHDTFAVNQRAAEQAGILGVNVIRSCSGGLMRWKKESPETEWLISEMAAALKRQKTMLQDHGVILAIETHFEFTTFELLRLFEMCGASPGEYLGVCLDTMNLLTMLEDPVEATRRILPWVVATHVKDGGMILTSGGLLSFPAEEGLGLIDLKNILDLLSSLDRPVHLSIEDHGGSFDIPIFDSEFLARFPDLTAPELGRLLHLAIRTQKNIDEGKLAIVERARWPQLCEQRVIRDIRYLKEIAAERIDEGGSSAD